MGALAIALLALFIAGALTSWVVAAVHGLRALGAGERRHSRRLAVIVWPFAASRLRDKAGKHAAVINKALVAFFVCVTLAATTISLATNFNRITK